MILLNGLDREKREHAKQKQTYPKSQTGRKYIIFIFQQPTIYTNTNITFASEAKVKKTHFTLISSLTRRHCSHSCGRSSTISSTCRPRNNSTTALQLESTRDTKEVSTFCNKCPKSSHN